MKKIIIGFSKSKKILPIGSWLIRLYQWTKFSHVYIRIPMEAYPSDLIVHASEGLVQHMSKTVFDKKHEIVNEFSLTVSDEKWDQVDKNLLHEIAGEKYSIMQNLGIFLVHILRLIGIRATNPWKSGWNCSEYVARVISMVLITELDQIRPNLVTPKDVFIILNKLEKTNDNIKLLG